MKRVVLTLIGITVVFTVRAQDAGSEAPFRFEVVSIDEQFKGGYQVKIADVNADGAPDIIALREGSEGLVAWYENPAWTAHRITPESMERPISLAMKDIDGDGDLDMALAHDFDFSDSVEKGAVSWLEQGEDSKELWTPHFIDREPMQHRVLWLDLDADGIDELISAPLMGRGTSAPDYLQAPVRIKLSKIPADPKTEPWATTVLYDRLHVVHGVMGQPRTAGSPATLFAACYEGLSLLRYKQNEIECVPWHEGSQTQDITKGSSEIEAGTLDGAPFYAAIEPRHGNEVAVYLDGDVGNPRQKPKRIVIDDRIQVGHGLLCADLNGDGLSEILVGDRGENKSYYLYYTKDRTGSVWQRMTLDEGGMAGAGCAVADLDGDTDLDIVAVGSATGNIRMYVNRLTP